MIFDIAIRDTKMGDKLIAHYQKADDIHFENAVRKVEELTPLAQNPKVRNTTKILQSGQYMCQLLAEW
jgi:hypothetical protein